ncbi:MAG: DUF1554 domain-containing protein [Myxococcales bacterium]|nr:DUF1554 domain-containing protein [Myxococcales bacterium]MDP3504881.1 DUF1554 domain-containing protein [Myxococcales bacterium]
MIRFFLPGLVVGFLLAVAPSCGRPCTAANCLGCCNAEGVCAPGVSTDACGVNGAACAVCQGCTDGVCEGPLGGGEGGGTSGTGGGGGSAVLETRLRVFITSAGYTGNLGGLAGADALCANAAKAANKGGTWKAFLSSPTEDAITRMADVGPWHQELRDGSLVKTFNNKANLTTSPLTTLYVNEQGGGSEFSPRGYWSGTLQTGLRSPESCAGWLDATRAMRGSRGSGGSWFSGVSPTCDSTDAIVCVEQSRDPRPGALPTSRKRVFITSAEYTGNLGGLAGADALCTNAAVAANKGGTWKAFLSSPTQDAISRMADVGPWHQELSDGMLVKTFNNKANLTTSPLTTLYVNEQGGGSEFSPRGYWSGTLQTGLRGPESCAGWVDASRAMRGSRGSGGSWFSGVSPTCDSTDAIVCVEQ